MRFLQLTLLFTGCVLGSRHTGSPKQVKAATESSDCHYNVEIMLVQDVSESYGDDLKNLASTFDYFVANVTHYFPGARFGFGTFIDKPGNKAETNECFRVRAPIGASGEEVVEQINKAYAAWGGDAPENSVGAMIRAAMSAKSGWTPLDRDDPSNPLVRVMVMSTDNPPHIPALRTRNQTLDWLYKWGQNYTHDYPYVTKNFTLLDEDERSKVDEDENYGCVDMEYPQMSHLAEILKEKKIIPLVLTGDWTWYYADGDTWVDDRYEAFAKEYNPPHPSWADKKTGLEAMWRDLLLEAGIEAMVTTVSNDTSDFVDKVFGQLSQNLPALVCTTTTEEPTDTDDDTTTTTTSTTSKSETTTTQEKTDTTGKSSTTTAAAGSGGSSAGIIGGAAGGAAAAIGAGVILARKFGMALPSMFNNSSPPQMSADVEVPETQLEREAFEQVTADYFT